MLKDLGYKVCKDEMIKEHCPLGCIELDCLQVETAEKNRSNARDLFGEYSAWSCFQDLERCLEDIEDEIDRSS